MVSPYGNEIWKWRYKARLMSLYLKDFQSVIYFITDMKDSYSGDYHNSESSYSVHSIAIS